MLFYKKKKLLIFFLFLNIYTFAQPSAKAEVKVEKLDKVLNWNDADFYKDADINIQLAKQIKKDRKRRIELKNKGYSSKEITRILKEEKNSNNINKDNQAKISQPIKHKDDYTTNDDNATIEDEIDDEEEYVLIRKKKNKNGKVISKKNKAYIIDDDKENVKQPQTQSNQRNEVKIISGDQNDSIKRTKNKQNNKKQNNFNIVPEIPKLPSESAIQNHNHYAINNANFNHLTHKSETTIHNNDKLTALSRQLVNLVGKNGDAEDIYMIKKMAEKNAFNYNENNIDNRIYTVNQEYEDEYKVKTNDELNKKVKVNNIKKPINNNNQKSSSRFYAYTRPDVKKILADMEQHNQNKTTQQDDDEIDITDDEKYTTSNQQTDDIEIVRNKYTEGQLIAKQIGAPQPVFRTKKNYNTQISPQNISQVKYNKDNKHLEPVMFQSQIINDVFANLGKDNATEIARALINQVGKVDVIDADGNSLLMHSIARKNQSLTAMLLSEGANPNLLNKDGFSPLHLASTNGDDIAIYYLMMAGGDPNLRDGDGNTSFMYASMTCNQQTLQMMISMGADLTAVNFANKNKSVLDYAKMNTKHPDVYQFLNNKIHQTKFVKSKDLNSE